MEIYLKEILAPLPIIVIFVALSYFKFSAHITCVATFILTYFLSTIAWDMPIINATTASLEGGALAVWPIIIVIIAAVFTYNLSVQSGSMSKIKNMLSRISSDKRILVLIIAWGFGGFLEAVAGFGTAVAIPASILMAMGFEPIFAAIICLIANTVPTAFGAIGIPIITLAEITNLDVLHLSYMVGLQLFIFIIIIPFVLVVLTSRSVKGIKGIFWITFISGFSFAITEVFTAKYLGAELPSVLGSLASLLCTIMALKLFYKEENDSTAIDIDFKDGVLAWLPYIFILIFIILTSRLFPLIFNYLALIKTSITIYTGDNATPFVFKWIATPGVIIMFATSIAGFIQNVSAKEMLSVFLKTCFQLKNAMLTIISIVALAKLMAYSGMINNIALVLFKITGRAYPFIAPLVGALGTFVTGSDTSSNVLFGVLQVNIASKIGVDPYWLAAANGAGATAGKMVSPQSIAVATAATNLTGHEGTILRATIKFCILYVLILGILVFIGPLIQSRLS